MRAAPMRLSLVVLFSACQLPTNFTPNHNNPEITRLKQENQSLQKIIDKLNAELKTAKAAPALDGNQTTIVVSLPGSQPGSMAASGPTSNPSEIEDKVLLGRAEQNNLVKEYGEEYVADLYRRSLGEAPNDPASLYLAARFSPDPDDQIGYCQRAVELFPKFGFGHHCLSVAHRKKGDGLTALQHAERAQKFSSAVEISSNVKSLFRKEMGWFTQTLSDLTKEASATREFSLGNAKTSVALRSLNKGLACSASLREASPWRECAGVICGEAVFSYQFDGPDDPYYSHTNACGDALVFSDQAGKTLLSETKLPCSRLDNGKTITAAFSVCLPSQVEQIHKVHLNIPGIQSPINTQ